MLAIIILAVGLMGVLWAASYFAHRSDPDDAVMRRLAMTIAGVAYLLIPALGFVPLCASTGGMMQNYSNGEREGYVIKISQKGVFWKTWECEMQLGAGQQASISEHYSFSVVDEGVRGEIQRLLGKRIRVQYSQWLIQPYQRGESGYEVSAVKVVE